VFQQINENNIMANIAVTDTRQHGSKINKKSKYETLRSFDANLQRFT